MKLNQTDFADQTINLMQPVAGLAYLDWWLALNYRGRNWLLN